MEFEQKAEEKKMSMSKNIARLAVTAGLTAALSFGGVMAPVTMAFAEGAATGSVTIEKASGNNTEFKGYKIFDADVAKDENGQTLVSNIAWANDKVETAVKEAIREFDKVTNIATAQDAADWISKNVMHTGKTTSVASDSAAYKIAAAVAKVTDLNDSSDLAATSNGVASNLSHGYWLFVTDAQTVAGTETATAPIFAVVGDEAVSITEKTSIPTVDKQVREGDAWGKVSDSYIGEEVEYKLTGSVASNIDTFTKYEYSFQDHLSVGLEAIEGSVEVTINDKVIQPENGYTVGLDATKDVSGNLTGGHDLTISFSDLKTAAKAAGVKLTGDSKVVVTYKAKLTEKAEYKGTGNTNKVELVYSNNPMTGDKGTSESDQVSDYVFGLDVTKTDPDNKSANLVAGFKVKMIQEGTTKKVSKWLKKDGSFTDDENQAYTFKTTGEGNKVLIPGLVEGTYLISESETPAGYNTIADFEIKVTPTYNATGMLTELKAEPNSGMVTGADVKNPTTTQISISIQNKKGSGLPLTGLNGVTFTWIAGGAVLCIGVAHLIRSRKQAEESEQE